MSEVEIVNPGNCSQVFLDYESAQDVFEEAEDRIRNGQGNSAIVITFDKFGQWVDVLNTGHSDVELIGRLEMAKQLVLERIGE